MEVSDLIGVVLLIGGLFLLVKFIRPTASQALTWAQNNQDVNTGVPLPSLLSGEALFGSNVRIAPISLRTLDLSGVYSDPNGGS